MIKKLLPNLGEYKKHTILTPILVIFEVILEILIPFLMSKIIDIGVKNSDVNYIIKIGSLMIVMALFSLLFGALSGKYASIASVGFSKNLRRSLFEKIQHFSFSNIDKYSTASLVTVNHRHKLCSDVSANGNPYACAFTDNADKCNFYGIYHQSKAMHYLFSCHPCIGNWSLFYCL
jgi:ABC-type multidrug transport system fused ATPase/permease subunit